MNTTSNVSQKLRAPHWKLPDRLILAALACAVYTWTLLPGVGYSGDTANLQFVGSVFGTTHPTGYPLYTLLNAAFVRVIPVGTLAFRVNLLSALFGVLAVLVLHRICTELFPDRFSAFAGAGAFAFTPVFWSQCIVAEVYSLHAFLMACVILAAVRWFKTRRMRFLLAGGIVYAFSFGNHLTSIMLLPALAFFVLACDWRVLKDYRAVLILIAAAALSAMQYGYFFWRYYDPGTRYLEMAVPSMQKLWWYISGAQFKDRMFAFTFQQLLSGRLPMFVRLLFQQYGALTIIVILGTAAPGLRRLKFFLLIYFAANTIWALNYDIPDIPAYFIPSFLVCAVYLASGFSWLIRRATGPCYRPARLLAVLVPALLVLQNINDVSQRGNTEKEMQIKIALEAVGQNALIISPDYEYSEYFWYFLIGENFQAGLEIYLMHHFSAEQVCEYLLDARQIFLPTERKTVPPGLDVFFFLPEKGQARIVGMQMIDQMSSKGLEQEPFAGQLLRVLPKNRLEQTRETES